MLKASVVVIGEEDDMSAISEAVVIDVDDAFTPAISEMEKSENGFFSWVKIGGENWNLTALQIPPCNTKLMEINVTT